MVVDWSTLGEVLRGFCRALGRLLLLSRVGKGRAGRLLSGLMGEGRGGGMLASPTRTIFVHQNVSQSCFFPLFVQGFVAKMDGSCSTEGCLLFIPVLNGWFLIIPGCFLLSPGCLWLLAGEAGSKNGLHQNSQNSEPALNLPAFWPPRCVAFEAAKGGSSRCGKAE